MSNFMQISQQKRIFFYFKKTQKSFGKELKTKAAKDLKLEQKNSSFRQIHLVKLPKTGAN